MYVPLFVKSDYSFLKGLASPESLIDDCVSKKIDCIALTDLNSVAGIPSFIKAAEEKSIKWIVGSEIEFNEGSIILLAKSLHGWYNLIKILNKKHANNLTLDTLFVNDIKDLICILGHTNSILTNSMFSSEEDKYDYYVNEKKIQLEIPNLYDFDTNFSDNLYIGLSSNNENIDNTLIECATINNIKMIALPHVMYLNKEDSEDHRILLCSLHKTTLFEALMEYNDYGKMADIISSLCFANNEFYLHDNNEVELKFSEELLENTIDLAEKCSTYNIFNDPELPKFCDNSDEVLKNRCEEGLISKNLQNNNLYLERLEEELGIWAKIKIADYFLIVDDYIRHSKSRNRVLGYGRGSSAGCLTNYLLEITEVNPLPYNLLTSRFFNEGRIKPGKISLPDIDSDFPQSERPHIIEYIRNKYGKDRVCQVVTFQKLMGKSAIKEVLRVHNACNFETMNEITSYIRDETKLSEQLQQMKDAGNKPSILVHEIRTNPNIQKWCKYNEQDQLVGDYAKYFEQAIRIEGVKKASGKHAAALLISNSPLKDKVFLVPDKNSGEMLCGFEYKDAEMLGIMKVDILGVSELDNIEDCLGQIRDAYSNSV